MAKISCIIPVYNGERYLRECLDSVIAQSLDDWQLVLVDDGSTDSSGAICDGYAANDPRISVIHTANHGLSAARNAGIAASTAPYMVFIDADDMVHPHFLRTLYDIMTTTGASVVACDMQQGHTPDWQRVSAPRSRRTYSPRQAVIDTLYQRHLNCSSAGKLFDAEIIRRAGGYVDNLWYEDLESFHRFYVAADAPIVHIATPMYFYRRNPDSFINTMSPRRLDVLRVTHAIESLYSGKITTAEYFQMLTNSASNITAKYPVAITPDPDIARAAADRRFSANYNIMLTCLRQGMRDQALECWEQVRARRLATILNPHVRLKNRLGALLALLGLPAIKLCARPRQ